MRVKAIAAVSALLAVVWSAAPSALAETFRNGPLQFVIPDEDAAELTPVRTTRGLVLATSGGFTILMPDEAGTDDAALARLAGPGAALRYLDYPGQVRVGARAAPTGDGNVLMQVVVLFRLDGGAAPILIDIEAPQDELPSGADVEKLVFALAQTASIVTPARSLDTLANDAPIALADGRIKAVGGVPDSAGDPGTAMRGVWWAIDGAYDVLNGYQTTTQTLSFHPGGWFLIGTPYQFGEDEPVGEIKRYLAENPGEGGTYTADARRVLFKAADGSVEQGRRGTDAAGKETLNVAGSVFLRKYPPADGTPLSGTYAHTFSAGPAFGASRSNVLDRTAYTFTTDGRYRRDGYRHRSVQGPWADDARVNVQKNSTSRAQGTYRIDGGILTLRPDGGGPDDAASYGVLDVGGGDLMIGGQLFFGED